MPHTSRRKQTTSNHKRREVVDADGWTKVLKSGATPRGTLAYVAVNNGRHQVEPEDVEDGKTLQTLTAQYQRLEARWLGSEAYKALWEVLRSQVIPNTQQIDQCLMFGSGSFSGTVNGSMGRHDVALYQLAIFKSMHTAAEESLQRSIPAYAQEPRYNSLDDEFLQSLKLKEFKHPAGFDSITSHSLTYGPGAEMDIELRILRKKPAVHLGHKVEIFWRNKHGKVCTTRVGTGHRDEIAEHGGAQTEPSTDEHDWETEFAIEQEFVGDRQSMALPTFSVKDEPFHEQYLYWPKDPGGGEAVDDCP